VNTPPYYVGGLLSVVISTGFGTSALPRNRGVEWFLIDPKRRSIPRQGYARVSATALMFPAVAVKADGTGLVAMSVTGPDRYPSAAYATFDIRHGLTGPIRIAAAGKAPEDGYSCYLPREAQEPTQVCRWGDYSYAFATSDYIAFGAEYIAAAPRTEDANWDTFIGIFR
jgi:hypothetical protein